MYREYKNLGFWNLLTDALSCLKSVQRGHRNVQNDEIGLQLDNALDGFLTVSGFSANQRLFLRLEQGSETLTNEFVIVGQKYSWH